MSWIVRSSPTALNPLESSHELVLGYAALASVIQPANIEPVVLADPEDDAVLACAVSAQAEIIVSGDGHLLRLSQYRNMPILTAAELTMKVSS